MLKTSGCATNEISLLAYYVAAVNLEQAYQSRMGGKYVAFPHIALTDTFQNTEDGDALDGVVMQENSAVVAAEMEAPISVIIGNPPYSVGQGSANDDNQNLKYESLDRRIRDTFAARSKAGLKRNLYDSYIRSIRWSLDRLGERGVLGFVTNGGFIDGNFADGMRLALLEENADVYVLNLRGNALGAGERRKREGGNVFGGGTRTSVVVTLIVRDGSRAPASGLHYYDIGDALSQRAKLESVGILRRVTDVAWKELAPTIDGDWLSQRSNEFESFTPMGGRLPAGSDRVFTQSTNGVVTNRDVWVSNWSADQLALNMRATIDTYNSRLSSTQDELSPANESTQISWTRGLRANLARGRMSKYSPLDTVEYMYRPFTRQHLYADRHWIEVMGANDRLFLGPKKNPAIFVVGAGESDFGVLAVDSIADLHLIASGQLFPRFGELPSADTELPGLFDSTTRPDNITHQTLQATRRAYADPAITSDDIFWFVYGVLHSQEYRRRFAADLKRALPRIPQVGDFWAFSKAGKELADLHLNYESADLYPLGGVPDANENLRVEKKMTYGGKRGADKTTLHYNDMITLTGIPERAHEYKLGSRSAIDWIVDRYYVRTDKASGIVNDANAWGDEHGNPRYILELIQRIVTVSLRTVDIVESLPPLNIPAPSPKDSAR